MRIQLEHNLEQDEKQYGKENIIIRILYYW